MHFNIKTILLTLNMVSAAMAICLVRSPGTDLSPTQKCPGVSPFSCAGTVNDTFGLCCSKTDCS
ncbi:hypothetical protein PpBr36_03804 [Pyricularia pennisetigena]|uniref:hypothetical protein n=1 Tax=Pyricularia pennisetigena TaxID=1578925 RepID=UPI0011526896|nr:hypothetical protein PpBr36_03804 [Pyricularia pennisetigena]TLS30252.1 hypothetical protein PpBr36_03804 [Pyricularia pennisetigena]